MVLRDRSRPDEADPQRCGYCSSHQLAMSQRRMKLTPSIDCAYSMNCAQRRGARGLAAPALVHGDGHHRRPLVALAHELVEAPDHRVEEVARAREARVHEEARVVVGLGVRDHEDRRRARAPSRSTAGRRRSPPSGRGSRRARAGCRACSRSASRASSSRSAGCRARARTSRSRAGSSARSSSRVNVQASFQRQPWPSRSWSRSRIHSATAGFSSSATAARRDRHRHVRLVEDAREPPHARAAAVLVVRLGAGIALRRLHARIGVLAPAVVAVVAPGHRVLRARLVDEHEVDDDARAVRPRDARRRCGRSRRDRARGLRRGSDRGIHGTS